MMNCWVFVQNLTFKSVCSYSAFFSSALLSSRFYSADFIQHYLFSTFMIQSVVFNTFSLALLDSAIFPTGIFLSLSLSFHFFSLSFTQFSKGSNLVVIFLFYHFSSSCWSIARLVLFYCVINMKFNLETSPIPVALFGSDAIILIWFNKVFLLFHFLAIFLLATCQSKARSFN